MSEVRLVPDSELDVDSDLVCTLGDRPFTGTAYEETAELGTSEVAYQDGLQHGTADLLRTLRRERDWPTPW